MERDEMATDGEEVYTSHTERELAFKLLAAHALVDKDFYEFLKADPEAAAASLHIVLEESDHAYLRAASKARAWSGNASTQYAEEIREALHAPTVVRSLW